LYATFVCINYIVYETVELRPSYLTIGLTAVAFTQ